ncbi:LysE family translocator [Streptomyces kaniharaensis]|uniref:LysE family translocator n=1 Tax=Streptomyces kaniharaensis TaxID=212423 RepID=A0A6N7KXM3_9ACTN|nr:LysE family translocator [Streptomyces kaniharaensis]MQS15097.1 LysE family translocator [Streptomyces kaniharaensis]
MNALTSVVDVHAMLGIAAVALGMVLTPGPNMIYLVSRSIAQGRRAGMLSLVGVATGFLVYLGAVTVGVAAVFTVVPVLYTAIKLAGAGYLLWLAWKAVKPGGAAVFAPQQLPPDPPRKLFVMGFLTCLLNPKIAIMYLSLLPQFVNPERGHVAAQSLLLGLTQIAVAVSMNGLIAMSAGSIASFLNRRPAWLRIQRYAMGTVLGGLALHIAADRAKAVAV